MGRGSRRRQRAVVVTLLASSLLLGACAPSGAMPAPTAAPSYRADYEAPPAMTIAPLTGEAIEAGALDHPSLAAKIDNHEVARPQVGLERTDLVFEELVEGGISRYVAVWHSDIPDEIGPIRSIRPMDPDIVSPLGGIIAYSGGQYQFVALMESTNVLNAIHGSASTADLMYRAPDRRSPHDVIVRARQLVNRNEGLDAPRQHFAFADDAMASTAAVDGRPVSTAIVRFSAATEPRWTWDATAHAWLRSQSSGADTDAAGKRLTAANVVVLRVPVSYGLGLPKTELIGSGTAWVLSEGKVVEATWRKASRTGLIRLTDPHGAPVQLAPGNSWIELMPESGSFRTEG